MSGESDETASVRPTTGADAGSRPRGSTTRPDFGSAGRRARAIDAGEAPGTGVSSDLGGVRDELTAASGGSDPASLARGSGMRPGQLIVRAPEEFVPDSGNRRRHFDPEALRELAESLRDEGQIQPIVVYRDPENAERYRIIVGERRWRAAMSLSPRLPLAAVVRPLPGAVSGTRLAQLAENERRVGFTASELALLTSDFRDEAREEAQASGGAVTDSEVAARLRVSPTVLSIRCTIAAAVPAVLDLGDDPRAQDQRSLYSLARCADVDRQATEDFIAGWRSATAPRALRPAVAALEASLRAKTGEKSKGGQPKGSKPKAVQEVSGRRLRSGTTVLSLSRGRGAPLEFAFDDQTLEALEATIRRLRSEKDSP